MKVNGKPYRTIWLKEGDDKVIQVINQPPLPHKFEILDITTCREMAKIILNMNIRGAGLIGAAAGYGMYLAALEASRQPDFEKHLNACAENLINTRPTAANLAWAVNRQLKAIAAENNVADKVEAAFKTANDIADEDADCSHRIGQHGLKIIEEIASRKNGAPVNILTHCNAGWLAFIDHGTATSPIYAAHSAGIPVHVWVDETRPRNQGARLTAWELSQEGVPFTVIADNTGGHIMQHGMVDLVITGADRVTRTGDAANKIGTYLKALAAKDNQVPFYIAVPESTFDWDIRDGIKEIPVEQRSDEEVKYAYGLYNGEVVKVLLTVKDAKAANYGFDVTPARLITSLITERGICEADEAAILELFPEHK
ncbi:S-methyl-5-thioribose-1-phosphate isomerase [bacterium E08(2017)]|nr:S-methyl-5-thioribose-1-phosphate isomerase [bacterium E08(2017)]